MRWKSLLLGLCVVIVPLILWRSVVQTRIQDERPTRDSLWNMNVLGILLADFAKAHDGVLPATLQDLVDSGVADQITLDNITKGVRYFVGSRVHAKLSPNEVVAISESRRTRITVLLADGRALDIPKEDIPEGVDVERSSILLKFDESEAIRVSVQSR